MSRAARRLSRAIKIMVAVTANRYDTAAETTAGPSDDSKSRRRRSADRANRRRARGDR